MILETTGRSRTTTIRILSFRWRAPWHAAKWIGGVAICGSGVGACVAANKVVGVRACLIHENFSTRQGVEDDDLNVMCLGGLVVGHETAWALVQTFLAARFSGAVRHRRRLAKVAALESTSQKEVS
jgi:RpiB/LacA/LacB family sugar-phosphate isomerase